jgi:hypothetical protein
MALRLRIPVLIHHVGGAVAGCTLDELDDDDSAAGANYATRKTRKNAGERSTDATRAGSTKDELTGREALSAYQHAFSCQAMPTEVDSALDCASFRGNGAKSREHDDASHASRCGRHRRVRHDLLGSPWRVTLPLLWVRSQLLTYRIRN